MTRSDLLRACFGDDELAVGSKILEMTEGADILSHLDLSYRRVVVRPGTRPGPGIQEASITLVIAAISNLCTDPAHRGEGYASALMRSAQNEAATHQMVGFAGLFAADPRLFETLGYFHPEEGPANFLVCRLAGEDWPAGRVDTRGSW